MRIAFLTFILFQFFFTKASFAEEKICLSEPEVVELTEALDLVEETEFENCNVEAFVLEPSSTSSSPFLGYIKFYDNVEGNAGIKELPLSLRSEKNECFFTNSKKRMRYEFKLRLTDSDGEKYSIHSRTAIYFDSKNEGVIKRIEFASRDTRAPLRATKHNKVNQGNRSHWTICHAKK